MEENKNEKENNNIEIVSAELLNPFSSVKNNPKENNVIKSENIKNSDTFNNKNGNDTFYKNVNNDAVVNVLKHDKTDYNNKKVSNNESDFYSNFEYSKNTTNDSSLKNKDVINIEKSAFVDLPDRKTSVPFIVMALGGFGIQFLKGYFIIIGFILCIISFICSLIMYRKVAKYAVLSILLSLIFIIIAVVINIHI